LSRNRKYAHLFIEKYSEELENFKFARLAARQTKLFGNSSCELKERIGRQHTTNSIEKEEHFLHYRGARVYNIFSTFGQFMENNKEVAPQGDIKYKLFTRLLLVPNQSVK